MTVAAHETAAQKLKRPSLFTGALQSDSHLHLLAGGSELRGDVGEGGLELRTQLFDNGDDDDGDLRFQNRSCAGL